MRPRRRLGAALFVGIAGAAFLAFRQPWQLRPMSPGEHLRLKAAKLFAARPAGTGFGLEGADLHDAVNAGSKSPIVGPAPIIDAPPKVTGAIIGPGPAPAGFKDVSREGAAAAAAPAAPAGKMKGAGKPGKGGKAAAELAPADDSRSGRKGRATRMDGAERARVSGKSAKGDARKDFSAFRKKGGAGRGGGPAEEAGPLGRARAGKRGASAKNGAGSSAEAAAASGSRRASGRGGRRGGASADSGEGGDAFARGNSKVKAGREGGGAALKGRAGRKKGGARGSKGGGKGGDGDSDEAAASGGGSHKKGKGEGKGGGGKGRGGKGGGKGGRGKDKKSGKTPSDEPGFHPILHGDLDGEKAPRPPAKLAQPPEFEGLEKSIPAKDGAGARLEPTPAGYKDIDAARPPKDTAPGADKFQWKEIGGAAYYCKDGVCGRYADGHWLWMQKKDGKWWAQSFSPRADGALAPDSPAYALHQGHWWWQDSQSGSWYVIHGAEPWSHRYVRRFKQDGLVHPGTGTQMIHGEDGRIWVVTPGKGAIVYDGKTGEIVDRVSDDNLPKDAPPKDPFPIL